MHAPATAAVNTVGLVHPVALPTIAKKSATIAVHPLARPSSPSVRFTAFTAATSTNAINGI